MYCYYAPPPPPHAFIVQETHDYGIHAYWISSLHHHCSCLKGEEVTKVLLVVCQGYRGGGGWNFPSPEEVPPS